MDRNEGLKSRMVLPSVMCAASGSWTRRDKMGWRAGAPADISRIYVAKCEGDDATVIEDAAGG